MLAPLSLEKAILLFESLPKYLQNPYLHPSYVDFDARYQKNTRAYFFGGEVLQKEYLFSGQFHSTEYLKVVDAESPRGYGGLVSTNLEEATGFSEAYRQYRVWLEQQQILVEFVRFHPLLNNHTHFDGSCFENRITCSVLLKDYNLKSQGSRSIRYIKKAKKAGCEVCFTDKPSDYQIESFFELYNQRMDELNGMEQYNFDKEYYNEIFLLPLDVVLSEVKIDGELIAASILMGKGDTLEYHLSCSNQAGRSLGATNLLLHQASTLYKGKYSFFHLGGGLSNDPLDPLFQFKSSVGKHHTPFHIGGFLVDEVHYNVIKESYTLMPGRIIFYRN